MRRSFIELSGGFYAAYMFVVNLLYAAYDSTMYSELTPHRARKAANEWLTLLKVALEKEEKFQQAHGFQQVMDVAMLHVVREIKA